VQQTHLWRVVCQQSAEANLSFAFVVLNLFQGRTYGEEAKMKKESVFRRIAAALFVSASSISAYHRYKAERASREEISL
jgi:hypothetical protein